jgi:Lamin Tail Domain
MLRAKGFFRWFPSTVLVLGGLVGALGGGLGQAAPGKMPQIDKIAQTITVKISAPANAAYNSSFTVAASGGASSNPIIYSASGVCINTLDAFTMTSGTGTCTVHYNQAGDDNYDAAPEVTESVSATKLAQAITVTISAPANAAYNSSFTVAATGGASNNPIVYSANGVCTNTLGEYKMTSGTGTCTVHYNQAGDDNFDAPPEVTESVSATKLAQLITFDKPAPDDAAVNGPTYIPKASANSALTVAFTVDDAATAVCAINAGAVYFKTFGTCVIDARQDGNANYNSALQVQLSFHVDPAAATHLVISEFRSRGPLGAGDEFVEIFNPTGGPVNISGWTIKSSGYCDPSDATATLVTIPTNVITILAAGQHYLVAPDPLTGSSVTDADRTYMAGIDDSGGVGLFNSAGLVQDMAGMCLDTKYIEGNVLFPFLENDDSDQSYERKPVGATNCFDTNDNARDFVRIAPADPQNSDSPIVLCTGVVLFTPTFTRSPSPTHTPTRAPTAVPGKVVINEFLPHPRTDWNGDGTMDTGDEYIEIMNMGTESINVANWKLDNGAGSTNPYSLPNLTLLPRQIAVFYHADTGLGLSDMGSTVRLLKPDGRTADIFNYPLVNAADRTWCRLPDGSGAWAFACHPTPGKPNEPIKSGTPGMGTGEVSDSICMKNSAPQIVLTAECDSPGGKMWGETGNSEIWLKSRLKWGVFVE